MRQITRLGSAFVLGATLTLAGACGRDNAANESVAGDSAAAATATPTDSAAMTPGAMTPGATTHGGAMTAPNALAMIGLSNAGEIATSEIAKEKATSKDVHAFAHMMVEHHQAMQKEADQLATSANITPEPPAQATDKKAAADRMVQQLNSTAKGAAFDRAYIDGQVQAHQQTLQELQTLQTSVDNAELRTLIEKAIPKVQEHLQKAQQLQSTLPQS
jgi:putative membrane protein